MPDPIVRKPPISLIAFPFATRTPARRPVMRYLSQEVFQKPYAPLRRAVVPSVRLRQFEEKKNRLMDEW